MDSKELTRVMSIVKPKRSGTQNRKRKEKNMGVDCRIWLSARVKLRDVADVIGILAGCKQTKVALSGCSDPDAWYVRVDAVKTESIKDLPECAYIIFPHKRGNNNNMVMYHFEGGSPSGERLIMPRSTPFWLALGHRLTSFFGGRLEFTDYDDKVDETFSVDYDIGPGNDEEWQEFQQRKWDLRPLTKEEINAYKVHAHYK